MTTVAPSTALATIQPVFTDPERLALAGFLAGYRGLTHEAYTLDLRQFTSWCRARFLNLFAVRRGDIESFARELEAKGRARATVTRRLRTIVGFYKYAVEEELLDHSPAAHVRRPRVDYESHAVALDRNELGALLVAAGLGPPLEHALISLLALNGLRVSEAIGADTEHLGLERGHRTLTITRKGGKVVTIPLAPRTARAIDLAIGERTGGPVFLAADGRRLDRHGAGRIARKVARRAGIGKSVTPHTLRHAFITAAWMPGCRCGRAKGGIARGSADNDAVCGPAAAWTGMRPTSSPPTSRVPPGKPGGWELFRLAATAARRKVKAVMVTDRSLNPSTNRRSAPEPPFSSVRSRCAERHLLSGCCLLANLASARRSSAARNSSGAIVKTCGWKPRRPGGDRRLGRRCCRTRWYMLVEELGFDGAVDYKRADLRAQLREKTPDRVDVFFDNVGGEILDEGLTRLRRGARVVICGAVSQYNASGRVTGPGNYMALLVSRASMTGFVVFDFASLYQQAIAELSGWVSQARLRSVEDTVPGDIEMFPGMLARLFSNQNTGKLALELRA